MDFMKHLEEFAKKNQNRILTWEEENDWDNLSLDQKVDLLKDKFKKVEVEELERRLG
jgi:hypothetical protein